MKSDPTLLCSNPVCRSLGTEFRGEEIGKHTLDTGHTDFYAKPDCHKRKTLSGKVAAGCGDGSNWGISEIRKATGYGNLKKGTLNVKLEDPHDLRPDYELPRADRKDGKDEDLCFECCCLVIGFRRVPALIARTSRNYWGRSVLEIMAEEMLRERYSLRDGDTFGVEVWVQSCTGPSNSAAS
jgi:CTP-dependent riboflavin kinase